MKSIFFNVVVQSVIPTMTVLTILSLAYKKGSRYTKGKEKVNKWKAIINTQVSEKLSVIHLTNKPDT